MTLVEVPATIGTATIAAVSAAFWLFDRIRTTKENN